MGFLKVRHQVSLTLALGTMLAACGRPRELSVTESVESPFLGMVVGRGYDYFQKEAVRGDCLRNPEEKLTDSFPETGSGPEARLSEYLIQSHEDLESRLGFSAGVKYRSVFYSAIPRIKMFENYKLSDESLTWLFSAKIAVREKTLKNLSLEDLTPQAIQLAENKDFSGFTRLCGTHFLRSVHFGGEFHRVYEISSRHKNVIRKIKSSLDGQATVVSGNAELKYQLAQAWENSLLRQETLQTGGSFVIQDSEPSLVKQKVAEWTKTLKNRDLRAFEVEMAGWETLIPDYRNPYSNDQQQLILRKIYRHYLRNKNRLEAGANQLSWHQAGEQYLEPDLRARLKGSMQDLESQQDQLIAAGRYCFSSAGACRYTFEDILLPSGESTPEVTLLPSGSGVTVHLDPGHKKYLPLNPGSGNGF